MDKPVSPANKIEIQEFSLWKKLKGKRVPLSFDLEITARCNMRCHHCYINLPAEDAQARAAELSPAEIISMGRQAVDLGSIWCLLSGGEPLLRPDFEEIYLGLKRLGLLVSVFTNATLITQKEVELFRRYPPRDLEVTVYGVRPETYEAVTRRPGSFGRFMKGFNLLKEAGIPVRLKAMAIKSNLHEQKEIAAFCRENTKDYFRFDPVLHLRFDGDPARNEEIRAERLNPEEVVALEEADEKRNAAMLKRCDRLINPKFAERKSDFLFGCGAGKGTFNISYDGRFRLCSSLWPSETTYDLRTGSLAEAWHNFAPAVVAMRSKRREFLETCHRCPIINLCLWCPAHAHLETGELDGFTPYFCAVAHKRAESIKAALEKAEEKQI